MGFIFRVLQELIRQLPSNEYGQLQSLALQPCFAPIDHLLHLTANVLSGYDHLRFPLSGLRSAAGDAQGAVPAGAVMQQLSQRAVGVGKVRRDEGVRRTPDEVVGVPIEAKLPLAAFCAGHVGGAEEQRLQSGFDFGWHVFDGLSLKV